MPSRERQTPAGYPHLERERHGRNRHRRILRQDIDDVTSEIFTFVDEEPMKMRAALAQVWIDYGINVRPLICTTWIDDWTEQEIEPISEKEECPVAMRLYEDFFRGMSFINDIIDVGQKEIDGNSDQLFIDAHESAKVRRSLGDYLREREYARKCSERLDKDPTGFKAIDIFYRELKLGRWNEGFRGTDSVMVLRGANLARELYKKVYPLTADLGSSV